MNLNFLQPACSLNQPNLYSCLHLWEVSRTTIHFRAASPEQLKALCHAQERPLGQTSRWRRLLCKCHQWKHPGCYGNVLIKSAIWNRIRGQNGVNQKIDHFLCSWTPLITGVPCNVKTNNRKFSSDGSKVFILSFVWKSNFKLLCLGKRTWAWKPIRCFKHWVFEFVYSRLSAQKTNFKLIKLDQGWAGSYIPSLIAYVRICGDQPDHFIELDHQKCWDK